MSFNELRYYPSGVITTLVTITAGDVVFRYTNDNITHNFKANEYKPYLYEISFPSDADDSSGSGKLTIQHNDELFAAMRQSRTKIHLSLDCEYINVDGTYNDIFSGKFAISDISKNNLTISANLKIKTVFDLAFPDPLITTINCPGLL